MKSKLGEGSLFWVELPLGVGAVALHVPSWPQLVESSVPGIGVDWPLPSPYSTVHNTPMIGATGGGNTPSTLGPSQSISSLPPADYVGTGARRMSSDELMPLTHINPPVTLSPTFPLTAAARAIMGPPSVPLADNGGQPALAAPVPTREAPANDVAPGAPKRPHPTYIDLPDHHHLERASTAPSPSNLRQTLPPAIKMGENLDVLVVVCN